MQEYRPNTLSFDSSVLHDCHETRAEVFQSQQGGVNSVIHEATQEYRTHVLAGIKNSVSASTKQSFVHYSILRSSSPAPKNEILNDSLYT